MQLQDLITEISTVVQDSSYTDAGITERINKAVLEIASGIRLPQSPQLTSPLPDLYVEEDLTLAESTRFVSLPANYHRSLQKVYDTGNERSVKLMGSFKKFLQKYPAIEVDDYTIACVVHGQKLYYHPAYTKTVKIGFYEKPSTLSANTDEPSSIPSHLQRDLIVNCVCREIFNQIEDGMEGNKLNTVYYDNEFFKAVMSLDSFIGVDGLPFNVGEDEDSGGAINI